MTLMSGKVYSDAGTPSNTIGDQGDIFMQLDGLKTTYRKEGGAWTPIGNQLGTIPEFLKGVGVPSNVLGQDNQYYREVNTDTIYEKQSGVWTNIASWTSLEIQQLLLSNGIGADLRTTNWIANIDTFIGAGEEGHYNEDTTGTKPSTYGLVKSWREDANHVYQKAETSDGKWATRKSGNGGATWPAWRIMANEDGDATRKFKALAGVAADDVAVIGQLPSIPAGPDVTIVAAGVINISKTAVANNRAVTSFSGYNLAGVTFSDAVHEASIVIDFTVDEPDANYVVVANTSFGVLGGAGRSCEPHTKTVEGFQIASFAGGENVTRPSWWADYNAGYTSTVNFTVYRF